MLLPYAALFLSALVAATFVPGSSEAVLLVLLAEGHDPFGLWAVATLGNTLGSGANWLVGRFASHFRDRRWFPVRPGRLAQARVWFDRWGALTLLAAWVPGLGDAAMLLAGIVRLDLRLFLLLVGIGKGLRYAVVLGLALAGGGLLASK